MVRVASIIVALAILAGVYGIVRSGALHPRVAAVASASSTAASVFATNSPPAGDQSATSTQAPRISTIDIHAIPLGDGHISTSPKVGYVYSCTTSFRGGGANHAGDWIGTSTWDLSKKIYVEGSVSWPNAQFSMTVQSGKRMITGNGLPVGEPTGIFPIQPSDPAYQYDRNPNSIKAQSIDYSLPADPTFAAKASCLPMGPIGIALDGVAIYNALDDGGRDAVAHEIQDSCDGHPQSAGQYHYHGPSPCMPNYSKNDTVVGYALDGFPITSMYSLNGTEYTNADLDACHGTTGQYYDANGNLVNGYHYVLTQEYPYTLGCFRGTPVTTRPAGGSNGSPNQTHIQTGTGTTQQGAPAAAVDACAGKASGASCSFTAPKGTVSGTCRTPPLSSSLTCVPG